MTNYGQILNDTRLSLILSKRLTLADIDNGRPDASRCSAATVNALRSAVLLRRPKENPQLSEGVATS